VNVYLDKNFKNKIWVMTILIMCRSAHLKGMVLYEILTFPFSLFLSKDKSFSVTLESGLGNRPIPSFPPLLHCGYWDVSGGNTTPLLCWDSCEVPGRTDTDRDSDGLMLLY
jgi:hypothetical protein